MADTFEIEYQSIIYEADIVQLELENTKRKECAILLAEQSMRRRRHCNISLLVLIHHHGTFSGKAPTLEVKLLPSYIHFVYSRDSIMLSVIITNDITEEEEKNYWRY